MEFGAQVQVLPVPPLNYCVRGGGLMARPLKYKTVGELQAAIDQYFEDCRGKPLLDDDGNAVTDKYGNPIIVDAKPPTITGLALALGFTGRKQLLDYQGRATFCNTITRAKARCEEYAESRLYDRDGANGAQFSLKYNFRWDAQKDAEADGVKIIDDL